jgi:hypothetical protein
VCDKCCIKVPELKCDTSNKQNYGSSDSDDSEQFIKIIAMQPIIESLQSVGEPLIKKTRLVKGKYPISNYKK